MSEQKFSASCHVHSQPARSDVPEAEHTLSGGASPHASERLDARGRSRAAASPRIRAGARVRSRSFRERPWVKAVSAAMAVLLAVTVFDTTGLAPLVQDAAAAPSAPAGALAQPAAAGEDAGDAATPSDDSAAAAVPAIGPAHRLTPRTQAARRFCIVKNVFVFISLTILLIHWLFFFHCSLSAALYL